MTNVDIIYISYDLFYNLCSIGIFEASFILKTLPE